MDTGLERLVDAVWDIEQTRTATLYRQHEQRELGKAAARGLATSNGVIGDVGEAYLAILDEKATNLLEGTRKILLAHAISPDADLREELLTRFSKALTQASAHARTLLDGLKQRIQITDLLDPLAMKSVELQVRRRHDFEIMLAEVDTKLRKPEPVSTNTSISFTGSQNVQIGDHNAQHNQVAVFRDLLTKIEQSAATPTEKAEAKSKLKAFLEHPLVVAVAGGLAGSLGESLK